MAKVADKALDMASGMLASVAKTLEKAAPEVWRIMIRQQYAKAVMGLIVPWMLWLGILICTIILNFKIKHSIRGCKEPVDRCDGCTLKLVAGIIIPIGLLGISGIWGANRLASTAAYLINPEFYAIRDLILMVLNRGQGVY